MIVSGIAIALPPFVLAEEVEGMIVMQPLQRRMIPPPRPLMSLSGPRHDWPCGHPRTVENTQKCGVAGVRCKICRLAIQKRVDRKRRARS